MVAAPPWRCEDRRLELVDGRVALVERGLDRVELRLEALRKTSRVGHLEQAPRLVSGELRGEGVELARQLGRLAQLLLHRDDAQGERGELSLQIKMTLFHGRGERRRRHRRHCLG